MLTFSATPNPLALKCEVATPPLTYFPLLPPLEVPGSGGPGPSPATSGGPSTSPRTGPSPPLRSYRSPAAASAAGDHLAAALLSIPGVVAVLIRPDFLTLTKSPDGSWPSIKRAVTKLLGEMASGQETN